MLFRSPKIGETEIEMTAEVAPIETLDLARLGLNPGQLDFGYDQLSCTGPATGKSETLGSIEDLVACWLAPVKPR